MSKYKIGKNPFELGKKLYFGIANGALFWPHESPRKRPALSLDSDSDSELFIQTIYNNKIK